MNGSANTSVALPEWENEGGGLRPAGDQGPSDEGLVVSYVAQYQVGPYRYTDLACARAELSRQRRSGAAPADK